MGRVRWSAAGLSALWLAALIAIPLLLVGRGEPNMIDLEVYRTGGQAWLDGSQLYAKDFPGTLQGPQLPFTYPPIAAILFGGLALIPLWLGKVLICVATFLAATGTCLAVASKLGFRQAVLLSVVAGSAVVGVLSQPFRSTLDFGQLNALLMVLVAVDCLAVRSDRFRGILIGLAAAIKLTPAVFIIYFLVRRDWRAAIMTIASFAFFTLLGLVFAFRDTKDYWFDALLDPSRVGGLAYATNQSLRGVLHRLHPPAESKLWALLALAVLAVAVIAALRAVKARNDVAALVSIATAGLLISPVSWAHHWVWVVPAMMLVGAAIWHASAWRYIPVFLGVGTVFFLGPFNWLPKEQDREMDWNLWQHVVGNCYAWLGLILLIVLAFCWRYDADPKPVESVDEPAAAT